MTGPGTICPMLARLPIRSVGRPGASVCGVPVVRSRRLTWPRQAGGRRCARSDALYTGEGPRYDREGTRGSVEGAGVPAVLIDAALEVSVAGGRDPVPQP